MNGVVPLLKPPGWTSQQAVAYVKRLYRVRAGHAGTLDPDAAGVLPVCLGPATRLTRYLMEAAKAYRFTACFGVATDTQDAAGRVVAVQPAEGLTAEAIEAGLGAFRGEISQVPPMFSAVKRDGQPLYKLARQGTIVEREPRRVTVYDFRLMRWEPGERPRALFDVRCSRGTYIRTLIDDLGRALGTGAHLTALLRRLAGGIDIAATQSPEELAQAPGAAVIAPADALAFLPAVEVSPAEVEGLRRGRPIAARAGLAPGTLRLVDAHRRLLALACADAGGKLDVERVFP